MKMEQTECSEKSEYKIRTPGNHPKESILHSEHGECLKSRMLNVLTRLIKFVVVDVSTCVNIK